MARIPGARPAGLIRRLAYFMCRKRLGRVVMPIQIVAHHTRLLRATAHMELGQEAARTVDARLKALVQVKVAMHVGCPF